MALDPSDLTALEPVLVARLKVQLPKGVHVLTAADLDKVAEASQPVPAVHIVYRGYRPTDARPDGAIVRLIHTWYAVVATRNVREIRSGQAARAEAGPLAGQVLLALMGFKPEGFAKPLLPVPAPGPGHSNGFQYMPLAFETETVLKRPAP